MLNRKAEEKIKRWIRNSSNGNIVYLPVYMSMFIDDDEEMPVLKAM